MDHLLEMETRRNESVNRILQSANSVGTELVEFEEWLYKRNAKLGAMTHALRAITQENKSLVQQRENHGRLQQTVQVRPAGIFHVDADRDGDAERGNRGDFGRRGGQSAQSRQKNRGSRNSISRSVENGETRCRTGDWRKRCARFLPPILCFASKTPPGSYNESPWRPIRRSA